jgi:RNA polymerase sigma-70 factor, ECF subfamily
MDETSFEALYNETARPLWSYIYRVSGNSTLADDLLQETYYRFLRSARSEMDARQTRSYLYRIATNLLKDHWRAQERETRFEGSIAKEPSGKESYVEPAFSPGGDLERVFENLNQQQRALLWLAYVEGNDHEEIARFLSVKKKSVRVLLFRARQRLMSLLDPGGSKKQEH